MARITGSGSDAIFSIRRFLGVNQAQEGEASLKTGEAAVCRNFRITSGGALRKRPGSSDVADLTTSYNVGTDRDSQSPLLESTGLLVAPLTMYPRISASPQGLVQTEGEARSVDTENWEEHAGEYYVHSDGMPWQLRSVETVPGDGNIQVAGGHIDLSDAMPVAVGEWDDTSGELDASGDQYIDVYPELACTGQTFSPRGEPVRIEPTEPVPAGWITQDQTGYFEYYGTPYAYYGLKSEQLTGYILWGRYQCTRQAHGQEYTYYTQGQWQDAGSGTASWASGSVSGYTGYVFDSVTGLFSGTGSSITLYGGDSGIVYEIEGSLCRKVTFTATSVVESATVSQVSQAQGPFTGTETEYTYTLGDKTGSEAYPAGDYPGESQGLEFTDTFTDEGVEYTVMTDGESFFAFAQEGERYDWTFAFYGRPITGEADSYTFIMSPTWSEPNTSQDTAVQGIWSGAVAGDQVLCAACNGNLWELEYTPPSEGDTGGWHRNSCGLLDTSRDVRMFGFQDKLYILNGRDYLVWDGYTLKQVDGYRPLVVTEAAPEGGGNTLEQVNKLTGARRGWWSPDGEASVFHLPESPVASVDYVEDRTLGARFAAEDYTVDLAAGTVTFTQAPENGVDSVEIGWSVSESGRDLVTSMTCAELYNGAQDSRVFLYGDGTNTCIYSGLDTNGQPRADYFPDLNEAAIGDSNTPITAMIRHYSSLLAFKLDSSWSVNYDTLTLPDGSVTAGFYITPVNRDVGCCALGQAQLVENRPRTLDGRSVVEWKTTSSSAASAGDPRNAQRISQRVDEAIRTFDLTRARTFYDKINQEYYVIGPDGTALVNNVEADAWYVYTGLHARCLISYEDQVYYGTSYGSLRHLSEEYTDDEGQSIDAVWESGAMDFGRGFARKYSADVWVGVKPEENGALTVTAQTDRGDVSVEYTFTAPEEGTVPETQLARLRARKFTHYKLRIRSNTPGSRATVVSVEIRAHPGGFVM